MKKFLVLFLTPIEVMEDWTKIDTLEKKTTEAKMKSEWATWIQHNAGSVVEKPAGAGKTKIVTQAGIADARNDVMVWAVVNAPSPDQAAAMFKAHPHLQIPESSIEIMEINQLEGMDK